MGTDKSIAAIKASYQKAYSFYRETIAPGAAPSYYVVEGLMLLSRTVQSEGVNLATIRAWQREIERAR